MRDCGNFIERGIIQRSPLLFYGTKMIYKGFFFMQSRTLVQNRYPEEGSLSPFSVGIPPWGLTLIGASREKYYSL